MKNSLLDNIDALLVTNPTNIRYLTGFVGAAPEERESYLLVTKTQTFLFTNALYLGQARNTDTTVIEISRDEPFAKKLAETFQENRLGLEENNLTVTEYQILKKELKSITLAPTQGRIEKLRMIKREDEIKNIRAAAKLTDQCFDFILEKIKPGVTEGIIAWEIESFIKTHGSQLAFSPIVAFGANTSQPHYQSSDVRLQPSDLILLDFGASVNGYCSDMTRMVFAGRPKNEWRRAYETVLMAQQTTFEYLGHQHSGRAVDQLARKVIEESNFPTYPHSLGHGVGLDIHEIPRLTIKKDQELKTNMVVTVEPGIYIEGQYGVRLEDLVLLKKDGIDILSKSPKKLTIL